MTARGAGLAGGSSALLAGGLLAADGLLVVLGGCGLLLVILAWLLGKLNLHRLEVTMHFPASVSAGTPFDLELTLHNKRSLLDAFQTEIQLSFPGNASCKAVAPWTAAGSASRIIQSTTIPGRGYIDTHHVTLSSLFPLGIFLSKQQLNTRKGLTIKPRPIIPMEFSSYGSLHDTLPHNGLTSGQSFGEPHGIRPWQAGDSARHIHWPASARSMTRGHGLRIREYDPPGFHPDQCHLIFHSYASGREMLREDRFERALSLLTGSLLELQQRGIPCIITCDFFDWEPVTCSTRKQVISCLMNLARVQRNTGTEVHDLENELRTVSPDYTLVVISDMSPNSWKHLLARHPQALVIDIRQISYQKKTMQTAV
ncbi:MAG: DUF58 domain-containing protein [Verrucomicrobiae bacterium]|nr:DUF58 domain-containing protein [Verrucomicrobiae bacterium]NNJ85637.1 DUF58 domain-containing protein [Akkermansiaceae bacterium]